MQNSRNKAKKRPTIIPLSLKYKPQFLSEVRGRDNIINRIAEFMEQGYVPNMLFYGLQGTGKTLIAELFLKEFLGERYRRGSYMIIDASVNNSVEHTREVLVSFMKTSSVIDSKKKVLLLDEVDEFSKQSQATLRRPIERTMSRCLVIMTCNFIDKLIQPLQSRFTKFQFGAIPFEAIDQLVRDVIDKENIAVDGDLDHFIAQICRHGKGDIRYILNNFMEHARASRLLDRRVIEMVVGENKDYAKLLFSGNLDKAIDSALRDPRASFSGAINYILDSGLLKISDKGRIKLMTLFSDAIRDLTRGMPYPTVVQCVSYRIHHALFKPNEKKLKK